MPDDNNLASRVEMVIPPWIQTLRLAAFKCLKAEDVKQIVQNQIAAAKKGDKNAIKFVFEQIMGGAYVKGATFIQNNYSDAAGVTTKALPGSPEKVEMMRRRVEAGADLHADGVAGPTLDLLLVLGEARQEQAKQSDEHGQQYDQRRGRISEDLEQLVEEPFHRAYIRTTSNWSCR